MRIDQRCPRDGQTHPYTWELCAPSIRSIRNVAAIRRSVISGIGCGSRTTCCNVQPRRRRRSCPTSGTVRAKWRGCLRFCAVAVGRLHSFQHSDRRPCRGSASKPEGEGEGAGFAQFLRKIADLFGIPVVCKRKCYGEQRDEVFGGQVVQQGGRHGLVLKSQVDLHRPISPSARMQSQFASSSRLPDHLRRHSRRCTARLHNRKKT